METNLHIRESFYYWIVMTELCNDKLQDFAQHILLRNS